MQSLSASQSLYRQRRAKRLIVGVVAGLLGFVLVMTAIILMNQQSELNALKQASAVSSVQAERREKPPQKPRVEKPKPPKKAPPRSAPTPNLAGAGLEGLDFGLPQYESDDLSGVAGNLLGDGKQAVLSDDAVDVPPRPIFQPAMSYPPRAKAQGVTGYVLLSLLISPTGAVEKAKVLESDPPDIFDDVALAGVQQWRFEPAQYQGEVVRVWARQRVRFGFN